MDYIGLFRSISNNCKYAKWYEKMIRAAQSREPVVGGERHHIIPRSFGMGGTAAKANIVALTGREHFVAHRLLHKSIADPVLKKKTLFAVFQMSTRMTVTSSVAGRAREDMASAMRDLWNDASYRSRGVEASRRLWLDDEYRSRHVEVMHSLWADLSYMEKQAKAAETKYSSDEYKKMRSELTRKQMSDPEQRAIAAKTLADAHINIDHTTEEWVGRSFRSEGAIKKQLESTKSEGFREKCREREMRKSDADRSAFASVGARALRDKFPDEAAYREYLSSRIKGRVKVVNPDTLEVRVVNQSDFPDGWVLYKTMSREQKDAIRLVGK